MKRMNMSAKNRERLASENMRKILTKKYGENYIDQILKGYVTKEML